MRAFSMRHAAKCQGAASYHAFNQQRRLPVLSDLFVVWSGVHVSCTSHQLDRSRSPKMHCIHLLVHSVYTIQCSIYLNASFSPFPLVWYPDPSVQAHARTRITACACGKRRVWGNGSLVPRLSLSAHKLYARDL